MNIIQEAQIEEIKLTVGKYRVKVKIAKEGGRLYLQFPYCSDLVSEIRCFEGATWHGFDKENPQKIWSINDSCRNRFQLAYLSGENPYAKYDKEWIDYQSTRSLYAHQKLLARHALTVHYCIWAAEMGCIDCEAIVHCNRAGRGFQITLKKLFYKFNGGSNKGKKWDPNIPTYIRSLCGEELHLNKVKNILSKGLKPVLKLTLESGKEIRVTNDHEICIGINSYIRCDQLRPGDTVLSNGRWRDKDGYIRVGGLKNIHPRWTTGGVYEHILVMEKVLDRHLNQFEVVHHKNGIKDDNRPENLELRLNSSDHAKLHGEQGNYVNLHNNEKVQFLPYYDTVLSVKQDGEAIVYDIICDDPYRNFVANDIIVHNCGKSLSAIEVMEQSGIKDWFWVGPRSALAGVKLEFIKWDCKLKPEFFTYEAFKKITATWPAGKKPPRAIIFDESSRLKNATAERTQAAQYFSDQIRLQWGDQGYVIEMSGSPSPNSPLDWWSQCEIACPGFIREGKIQRFRERLALFEMAESPVGGKYPKLITWYDDENKCKKCGKLEDYADHDQKWMTAESYHQYEKSFNEVSYLYERMKGLVQVVFKKDCLDLPDKIYRIIECPPSREILNAARIIEDTAPSAIKALTLMRELSDGFQYIEQSTGEITICEGCNGQGHRIEKRYCGETDEEGEPVLKPFAEEDYEEVERNCSICKGTGKQNIQRRIAVQVPCPKENALIDVLDEHDDIGRLVIYGGFTGTIDRIVSIVEKYNWKYIRVDGRGWETNLITGSDDTELLQAFQDKKQDNKICFVGQPGAAGMGITLTASPTICYYSNDFNAESRIQSEDRIHRPGMDVNLGATIIDLIHLPSDLLVLKNLQKKRDLQGLTLGEMKQAIRNLSGRRW